MVARGGGGGGGSDIAYTTRPPVEIIFPAMFLRKLG